VEHGKVHEPIQIVKNGNEKVLKWPWYLVSVLVGSPAAYLFMMEIALWAKSYGFNGWGLEWPIFDLVTKYPPLLTHLLTIIYVILFVVFLYFLGKRKLNVQMIVACMLTGCCIFTTSYLDSSYQTMVAPGQLALSELKQQIDMKSKNGYPPYKLETRDIVEHLGSIPVVDVFPRTVTNESKDFTPEGISQLQNWLPIINYPYHVVLQIESGKESPYFIVTEEGEMIPASSSSQNYSGPLSLQEKLKNDDVMKRLGYETPQMVIAEDFLAEMNDDIQGMYKLLMPKAKQASTLKQLEEYLNSTPVKEIVEINIKRFVALYSDNEIAIAVFVLEGKKADGEVITIPRMQAQVYVNGQWLKPVKEDLSPDQIRRTEVIMRKWADDQRKLLPEEI